MDNIPAEMIKEGDAMTSALKAIYDKIWKSGEWPTQWTQFLTITLPKETCNVARANNNNKPRIERLNSRYFTMSPLRHKLSPMRALKWPGRSRMQITSNTSRVYHMQHVVCHVVRRDSSAIKSDKV